MKRAEIEVFVTFGSLTLNLLIIFGDRRQMELQKRNGQPPIYLKEVKGEFL